MAADLINIITDIQNVKYPDIVTKHGEIKSWHTDMASMVDEITGLNASATTLDPGLPATATYDHVTGSLIIGVPKGVNGDSLKIDATVNLIADRAAYDDSPANFAVLVANDAMIYVKLSATSADWSTGISYGSATTFTSLTDTPSSYEGLGGYALRINTSGTAIEAFLAANQAGDATKAFSVYTASSDTHAVPKLQMTTLLAGKVDKIASPTAGNIANVSSTGGVQDSGVAIGNYYNKSEVNAMLPSSGKWTPTNTPVFNITAVTLRSAHYIKVGSFMQCSIAVYIDFSGVPPDASFFATIPEGNNFTSAFEAIGIASSTSTDEALSGSVESVPSSNKVLITFATSTKLDDSEYKIMFSYEIK